MPGQNYIRLKIENASLQRCLRDITQWSEEKKRAVREEVATSVRIIEGAAKRDAPVAGKGKFGGRLRSGIFSQLSASGFGGRVWVSVSYAPYQEFGTGDLVDVPAGWEEFAMQFKGRGIRKVNIRAKRFLFNAWANEIEKFIANLKNILGVR